MIDQAFRQSGLDGLTLSFMADYGNRPASAPIESYAAVLADRDGRELLTLRIPSSLVEPAVLARVSIAVSISLSGEVCAELESGALPGESSELRALDALVARAIDPSMLQDEPDARELLRPLWRKLETAIDDVDVALVKIAKA